MATNVSPAFGLDGVISRAFGVKIGLFWQTWKGAGSAETKTAINKRTARAKYDFIFF